MPLIGVKSQRERRADEIFPRSLLLGRNHFPQFLNSSLQSALFALVILVPLRQTGHLALESSPQDLHRNLAVLCRVLAPRSPCTERAVLRASICSRIAYPAPR